MEFPLQYRQRTGSHFIVGYRIRQRKCKQLSRTAHLVLAAIRIEAIRKKTGLVLDAKGRPINALTYVRPDGTTLMDELRQMVDQYKSLMTK